MKPKQRRARAEKLRHIQQREETVYRLVHRLAVGELVLAVLGLPIGLAWRIGNEPFAESTAFRVLAAWFVLIAVLQGALLVSFLRWLSRCIEHEGQLDSRGFQYSPSAIVWAYVIPVVNLVRPLEIIGKLAEVSDPSGLPVERRQESSTSDYREAPRSIEGRDTEAWRRSFPLRLWWVERLWCGWAMGKVLALPPLPVPELSVGTGVLTLVVWSMSWIAESFLFVRVIEGLEARRRERTVRLLEALGDA